ncbi:bifunctional RNase H/acid phosphatase [Streptomyces sp. NPDC087903]|uniref:bifunctional RNase H/acid phosphatase n=1 Tax=Streptomyces sp. NPDC087903 TaxID=3365819 RepID=UPI003811DDC0
MREFIVEADGGSRGNPGPAGYGSVVLDAATGETLAEAAEYIGVATNNVAEYRGLLAGLRAAHDLDPSAQVHVRMDSKLVVEQMSGRWKIKHPAMKPLATEASRVFPPSRVTYEWIPRERNKHADRLANEAMDAGRRGERWSASTSTAELDTAAGRAAATTKSAAVTEPSGPPGDAVAGAARARAALTEGRSTGLPNAVAGRPGPPGPSAGSTTAGVPAGSGGSPTASAERGEAEQAAGDTAPRAGAEADAASLGEPLVTARGAAATSSPEGEAASRSEAEAAPLGERLVTASGAAVTSSPEAQATSRSEAEAAPPGERLVTASGAAVTSSPEGEAASRSEAEAQSQADVRAARVVAAPSAGWAPADLGAPATFVLLRHGETPLTPQKRFSGSGGSDPSLSAVGREQAERVAAALARRGTIQAIVSSPLARTRETAATVADRLGLEVVVEDGLRETDFGAWEGLTFGEVRDRHPEDLNAWLADPEAEPTGGGESFATTATRIAATRDRLVAAYAGRTVLLVTHVTPIKTFVRLALGAPPESLFRMELSAAALSAVAYYSDGNASVRLLNDTSHLR